jgi:hypothetical protein
MMREISNQKNKSIVYYFFDSARNDSLSMIHFLRSVLHQLLRTEDMTPTIQQRLEAIIGVHGEREPDIDELQPLIVQLCYKLNQVFFLIDGIDEIELEERRVVFRFLRSVWQARPKSKFYISSLPEVDIATIACSWKPIYLNPDDLDADIQTFIDFEFGHPDYSKLVSICGPAIIEEIKKSLSIKAQGMYVDISELIILGPV